MFHYHHLRSSVQTLVVGMSNFYEILLADILNDTQLINYLRKSCAADGTLRNIYEDNLLAEYHLRYGARGGIAYYHVANNYIAFFASFIPCGVWEAIAILECWK